MSELPSALDMEMHLQSSKDSARKLNLSAHLQNFARALRLCKYEHAGWTVQTTRVPFAQLPDFVKELEERYPKFTFDVSGLSVAMPWAPLRIRIYEKK